MPCMSKYLKGEWADYTAHRKYNELCKECERSCKQSYRSQIIYCPKYLSKRRCDNNENNL